jgi:hypothetical protein
LSALEKPPIKQLLGIGPHFISILVADDPIPTSEIYSTIQHTFMTFTSILADENPHCGWLTPHVRLLEERLSRHV